MTNRRRTALIAIALLGLFSAAVALVLHVMPQPLRSTDYLISGGVATVVCMAVLFVFLISTTYRTPDVFFRRR